MADKIAITKGVVKFVVGASTGFTVKRIIDSNVETDKARHQAEAYVGGAVIGAMVAEQSEDWIDRKIDKLLLDWQELKTAVKNFTNK